MICVIIVIISIHFCLQDRVITENKELHLKMGLILDENARLKSIIYSMQQQQQQNGERNNEDDQLWSITSLAQIG